MLEDLRARLEPVGRLDVLDAVGEEAMEYFAVLGDRGTQSEVFARAMALRQIGEVRFRQGQMDGAQEAFQEARNITSALVANAPQNERYLFELGQAAFWVGYAALELSQTNNAIAAFTAYTDYSRQLLAMDPANPDYQLELMFAYSNLGTIELSAARPMLALENFELALQLNQELVESSPNDPNLRDELGNSYSWIGVANLRLNQLAASEAAYQSAVNSLLELHESGENRIHSEHYGQNNYLLGNVQLHMGNIEAAGSRFQTAREVFGELVEFDEENTIWRTARGISAFHFAQLQQAPNPTTVARDILGRAVSDFEQALEFNARDIRVIEYLALAEQNLALMEIGNTQDAAIELSIDAYERMKSSLNSLDINQRELSSIAEASLIHGRLMQEAGDSTAASEIWQNALNLLDSTEVRDLRHYAVRRQLYRLLQQSDAVAEMDDLLTEAGFADPRYF